MWLLLSLSYRIETNKATGRGMKSTIFQFWKKHRAKLIHDYSLVGYMLSPNPTIMEHAVNNKIQIHDDDAERLITKLLLNPAFVGNDKIVERTKLRHLHGRVWRFHQQAWYLCQG